MDMQKIPWVDTSSEDVVWGSLQAQASRGEVERRLFAVTWVTWLHQNKVIFNGREASANWGSPLSGGICFFFFFFFEKR